MSTEREIKITVNGGNVIPGREVRASVGFYNFDGSSFISDVSSYGETAEIATLRAWRMYELERAQPEQGGEDEMMLGYY